MDPTEALRYLKENSLPRIASFSLEEERGHVITGKSLCYIEDIFGTSRVKLGGFTPHRCLFVMRMHEAALGTSYAETF